MLKMLFNLFFYSVDHLLIRIFWEMQTSELIQIFLTKKNDSTVVLSHLNTVI